MIHIDPEALLGVLDERGWTKGSYNDDVPDAPVCLHGAIRLCSPQPGDAHIIEHVLTRQGHGPGWNDRTDRTEAEVREYLSHGVDVTDDDLAETFGPQWEAVVEIVRTSAAMTGAQAGRLDAAWDAARNAAGAAAWDAAWGAQKVMLLRMCEGTAPWQVAP